MSSHRMPIDVPGPARVARALAVVPASRVARAVGVSRAAGAAGAVRAVLTTAALAVAVPLCLAACASRTPAADRIVYVNEVVYEAPGSGRGDDRWAAYRDARSAPAERVRDDIPESARREWVAKQSGYDPGRPAPSAGATVREVIREVPVRHVYVERDRHDHRSYRDCDDRSAWALPVAVSLAAYGYHRRGGRHAYWYRLGAGVPFWHW